MQASILLHRRPKKLKPPLLLMLKFGPATFQGKAVCLFTEVQLAGV